MNMEGKKETSLLQDDIFTNQKKQRKKMKSEQTIKIIVKMLVTKIKPKQLPQILKITIQKKMCLKEKD